MSTPKGYPSQTKIGRVKPEHATVEAIRTLQHGLSVLAHMFVYSVGTDAAEAASTTEQIKATAHAAQKGDVIRFTSGTFSGREIKVHEVTTNFIELAETLSAAPSAGDTFQILRHKYPIIAADGSIPVTASIAQTPIQFVRNGVDTEVEEDTVTPANNRPLPVKLTGITGDITVTAQNLNVQSTHTGANPDSMQIGDGTETVLVNASGEMQVADDTARTTLSAISGKLPATLGQKAMAASLAVVIASDQSAVPVSAASLPLPSGAATEATLAAMSAKLPATLGQKAMAASFAVVIASDQTAVPVSQSGTWNVTNVSGVVSLPTGASTSALQTTGNTSLSSIDGKLPATLGQKAMAASLAVVIASDQSAVPASQSGTWNINNVSGTVSLPTGAATGAKQDTGNTSLASIDGKITAVNTGAVVVSSSALPSGASTSALQTTGNTSLSSIDGKLPTTLGQKTMANSLAVVIASDQSAVTVTGTVLARAYDSSGNGIGSGTTGSKTGLYHQEIGYAAVDKVRNDYSSTNVTTGAYVQLIASLAAECQEVEIFDSSGQTLFLATGAAASESNKIYIIPGGNGRVKLTIPSTTRISVKAVSATASVGELTINFYG